MSWWEYRPRITAADLLDSGACLRGVSQTVARMGVSEAPTSSHRGNHHVRRAARVDPGREPPAYGHTNQFSPGDGWGDEEEGDGSGAEVGSFDEDPFQAADGGMVREVEAYGSPSSGGNGLGAGFDGRPCPEDPSAPERNGRSDLYGDPFADV